MLPQGLDNFLASTDERLALKPVLAALHLRWPEALGVRLEVLFYNQEQNSLEQIEQVGFERTQKAMRVRKVPVGEFKEGDGICAYVASTGKSELVPHVRFDRRYARVLEQEVDPTQSELVVPLKLGSRLLGILNLEADVPRAFDNDDLQYCEQLSPLLGILIDYETYRLEETFLRETENSIALLVERDAVLQELLDRVLGLVGSDSKGCMLIPFVTDREIRSLQVVANRGLDLEVGEVRSVDTFGVIRLALASPSREKYWTRSDDDREEIYVELAEDISSEFAAVLEAEGQVIALINVESTRPTLSERYRRAILQMAKHTAVLLHSLGRKGDLERQQGAETILEAAKIEAHTLRGMASLLTARLSSFQGHLPATTIDLGQGIQNRIEELDGALFSYHDRVEPVSLRRVVELAQSRARQIGVDLDCSGTFDIIVSGSETGFGWILENLILNTRKHGGSDQRLPKAWLAIDVEDGKGVLRYWDDGSAPDLENIMTRNSGQGLRIVDALCRRYDWQVHPGDLNGSLQYTFKFRCVRDTTRVFERRLGVG